MPVSDKYDALIVGGLGHVGLPPGLILADAGLQVALYDLDQHRRARVAAGKMPFLEYDAEPLLQRVTGKTLHLADGLEDVARAQTIIVTVGVPHSAYRDLKVPEESRVIDLWNVLDNARTIGDDVQ